MRIVLLFTSLFIGSIVFAQDIIVTKKGEEIESKVVEVGLDNIKYKKFGFLDGPNYVIRKSNVVFIRYENGTKEVYANENDEGGIDSLSRKGIYLGFHATPGLGRVIHRNAKFSFAYQAGYDITIMFNENVGVKTGFAYTSAAWSSGADFYRYNFSSYPSGAFVREGDIRGEIMAIGVPFNMVINTGNKLGFYMEYGLNLEFVLNGKQHYDLFDNEYTVNADVFGTSSKTLNHNNIGVSSNLLIGVHYKNKKRWSYKLGVSGYYTVSELLKYEDNSNAMIFGLQLGVNYKISD